jgi:hypothetical protein
VPSPGPAAGGARGAAAGDRGRAGKQDAQAGYSWWPG